MEFSWDLLESTLEKVSDVLGDTISEQDMMEQLVTNDCEVLMDMTNGHVVSNNNSDGSDENFQSQNQEILENMSDDASDLLPLSRERSNTWPKRHIGAGLNAPDTKYDPTVSKNCLPLVSEEGASEEQDSVTHSLGTLAFPKMNSRRNPWGSYSYADLIVQAIVTSPDQRLTLNQIYDWMISNVPYFSERQDNASSAGWKNSIRHNLSLHQKFLKIPNEDAGKSSWWTINPETKQTKKPRRRATYGDSQSFQNKREKAKKKVETLRNKGRLVRASSTNGLYPLSPIHATDSFRIRSNSSASSCDDNPHSPFRSPSFSNTSSLSPIHLPEMTIPSFSHLVENVNAETDLDDIRLDDLNLGSGQNLPDPAEIIREYLHPGAQELDGKASIPQNITILEPRDNETVGNSVIKFANSNFITHINMKDSLFGAINNQDTFEKHDEERNMMIRNKLNSLIQKRLKVIESQSALSFDNKKNLESAFDIQIKLLQEELDKLERKKSNKFSDDSLEFASFLHFTNANVDSSVIDNESVYLNAQYSL